MYDYQQTHTYTAQVADGLEALVCDECTDLGATHCEPGFRFVRFQASPAVMYRIVYYSRLATRVLAPLRHCPCPSAQALYAAGRDICWSDFLSSEQTFAITANVSESAIGHSQFAALKLKDAVADWFRDHGGHRPNVDTRQPDLWIHLHIRHDQAVISIDVSGGSLHRRGYRMASVDAPMHETVAAAMLRMSGWDGTTSLIDPLCGSGTIICEALMLALNLPAALLRSHFGFMHLPDFAPQLWSQIKSHAHTAELPALIRASDVDPKAVAATRTNLGHVPGGDEVLVGRKDFFERTDMRQTTIICNPPYGLRLGRQEDMGAWYKRFGDHIKQHCTGSTAYVYFGDRTWLKHIGLRPEWKKPLKNGGLDGRLAKFVLY
ncbi:MAG: class I SAM-dependent RNA methyltransferase [Desulfovibrionales bacterium]|nr:class I SAM-dependent RNA methyltransferase [Desulfovibrionales bacterium]